MSATAKNWVNERTLLANKYTDESEIRERKWGTTRKGVKLKEEERIRLRAGWTKKHWNARAKMSGKWAVDDCEFVRNDETKGKCVRCREKGRTFNGEMSSRWVSTIDNYIILFVIWKEIIRSYIRTKNAVNNSPAYRVSRQGDNSTYAGLAVVFANSFAVAKASEKELCG